MAAAAALRCCFPGSAIGGGFIRPSSSRRGRHAAAVVAPSREAEPAASLGHRTRVDFPILHQEFDGAKLVYFDNGATSQKPYSVMKTLDEYYRSYNSNVHRGIHALSAKATDAYEGARRKVANFVNAADSREIVFTRNATEAINLVAYSWGLSNVKQGDEVSPLFPIAFIMFCSLSYLLLMFLTFYMIRGTVKILLSQFWLFTSICVKKKALSSFLCCLFIVKCPSNDCQRIKSSISDLFFGNYEVFCTS
jgi:hypothetical protein